MNDNASSIPSDNAGPQESHAPASTTLPMLDQPLDAIVEENYPPIAIIADYPYGPRTQTINPLIAVRREPATGILALFNYQPPAPAQYMVPRRFGMSAILGIMTALAILFGCFRLLDAHPMVYLFFGMQTLVICFAQMLNSKSPRLASSIAGALLAPIFVLPLFFVRDFSIGDFERIIYAGVSMIFVIPFGAFLGYLTGTCAAGIFLVMDYLEPYLQGHAFSSPSSPRSITP
jgi:hypothetical protein